MSIVTIKNRLIMWREVGGRREGELAIITTAFEGTGMSNRSHLRCILVCCP